jgi:hypothetical protein
MASLLRAVAASTACAALAACGARLVPASTAAAQAPESSATQASTLLYVSDWATNDVFVYDYATRTLVTRLDGLLAPSGECVDRKHDVWIAELRGSEVVEYAHGGKAPIKHLRTDGYPIGCAVDVASGNLAVVNFYTKRGAGSLQIWKRASGNPTTYAPSQLYYLWPPAYDGAGNVVFEGEAHDGTYGASELSRGSVHLRALTLHGARIHYAGGTLWDGKHVAFTDQAEGSGSTAVLYRVTIAGTIATVVGRTPLDDSCHGGESDVVAPFVVRSGGTADAIVGGNLACRDRFDYWRYPAGGAPTATLHDAPAEPFGGAVSERL